MFFKHTVTPKRRGIVSSVLASAGLVVVTLIVLVAVIACPAASSDSGGASDEVRIELTNVADNGISILVPDSVTEPTDSTLWWAVFEEGTELTTSASLTAVMNVQGATPTGTVTAADGTEGPATLFGSSGVTGVAIGEVLAGMSTHPVIMGDLTMAIIAGMKYDIFIVIGTASDADLILKPNITATVYRL